jgi:hypothetical protein
LWIEGDPDRLNRPRAFERPRTGRSLYRHHPRQHRLAHVDYLYVACPSCGMLHPRRSETGKPLKECLLCQTSLSPSRA